MVGMVNKGSQTLWEGMVNKGSDFANFVRFHPYTYSLHAHSTIPVTFLGSNKLLKLNMLTIVLRSDFEDGEFDPQIYLDECLHEL